MPQTVEHVRSRPLSAGLRQASLGLGRRLRSSVEAESKRTRAARGMRGQPSQFVPGSTRVTSENGAPCVRAPLDAVSLRQVVKSTVYRVDPVRQLRSSRLPRGLRPTRRRAVLLVRTPPLELLATGAAETRRRTRTCAFWWPIDCLDGEMVGSRGAGLHGRREGQRSYSHLERNGRRV